MTRTQIEALQKGATVHRGDIRATLYTVYRDAPYALVMAFPQDVNWSPGLMWQKWPIGELSSGGSGYTP